MFALDQDRFAERLRSLQNLCIQRGCSVATAESCTGGLLGALLTHLSGSSAFFLGGIMAYANQVKVQVLRVPEDELAASGAVSEAVACSMARGARQLLGSDYAVAITGIAGPGGGTPDKPVGTVCCAWSSPTRTTARRFHFQGDRESIRAQACWQALEGLHAMVSE